MTPSSSAHGQSHTTGALFLNDIDDFGQTAVLAGNKFHRHPRSLNTVLLRL